MIARRSSRLKTLVPRNTNGKTCLTRGTCGRRRYAQATPTDEYSVQLRYGMIEIHDPTTHAARRVSGRWLRDNCSCAACRNASTGQRQINVFKDKNLGALTSIQSNDQLSFEATFKDGHRLQFQIRDFFKRRTNEVERLRTGFIEPTTWTSSVAADPPTVSYADVQDGHGLSKLLLLIKSYGFAFVADMPATPEATEALIEQVGPIRNTHYGAFYDFTSDLSSKDTAYTAEALESHTDTTYFTEPIGIQALHLLSHTDGNGGLSSLVDGFQAALELKAQSPTDYDVLSRVGIYAHASGNEGISIQPALPQPVLSHYPQGHPLAGQLMQVRWNNADRAGVAADLDEVDRWYEAASKFDDLVSRQANVYWFQLQPGKCLFFDNWRTLHGRSEFTGKRRLCGGYVNRDDFISKLRMTTLSDDEIRASTVTG